MLLNVKRKYEQKLFKDIRQLSDADREKLIKFIHSVKNDISNGNDSKEEGEDLKLFWQSFGSWQDNRSAEEIIQEIYESRQSRI
jgi:hypothetical protein